MDIRPVSYRNMRTKRAMNPRRSIALVLLLATACTPMQWVKPDAPPEQIEQDLKTCQDEAWREVNWRSPHYYGALGPMLYPDYMGRRFLVWPYGPFADPYGERFLEEARLADFCMRAKGYELAPVKK